MGFFLCHPYSPLLLLVFLASSYFLLKRRKSTKNLGNLPPGSFGWPVIGETLEFLSESPENFILQKLKKYSTPVFKTNILGENMVFFSGADANKFITTNEQTLVRVWFPHSQQRLFGLTKNNTSSQNNNQQQKAPPGIARLYGFLKPQKKFVEKFDSLAKQQLSKYCELKENDAVVGAYQLVKSYALALFCDYLLGMEPERAGKLAGKIDDVVNGIQSVHVDFPGTVFHRAKKAAEELKKEIEVLVKEKSEGEMPATAEDLLSIFIAGDRSGKVMLPSTVSNLVMGIMAASYGSVVTTLSFMVKFIGLRPDVYEKIYSEQMEILALKGSDALNWDHINRMKYTWAAACETMRIAPPFLGTFREALTDFNFAGFAIPKGWKIFWAVSMTNKNPECFPEPEKFDPSRFMENEHLPHAFLPFGGGPRMCAGKEYARLAMLIFMHNLVTKFRWDVLFPNERVLGGLVMPAPVKGLPVRLYPASPKK